MSSPASYPKAAGPAGQTAGRATCGVRALVAPGALLKPASEAECRGTRPIGDQRRPVGRRRVRWRDEWRPRHMRENRARRVGEPRGSAQEGPGGRRAVRNRNGGSRPADEDEGNGLASESRAGRCLANSMHATGVEASAASVRPPPWGLPGSRMRPGSPGAGLPYLSPCGLVLYGQGGARESRAWSHVCQADPSARNLTGLLSESRQ